ncbi:MAG: hypothetical protein ACPGMR_02800 [Pontibacterium sp.]
MSLLTKVRNFKQEFGKKAVAVGTATALTLAPVGNALAADFNAANVQNASLSQQAQPSQLVPDENGVLWFKKGQDAESQYSLGLELSTPAEISIVASSSPGTSKTAVSVGKQIKTWLESHPDIDNVPLVVSDTLANGGSFTFYIGGRAYRPNDNHNGTLQINEISAQLPSIVETYRYAQQKQAAQQVALQNNQYALN